MEGGRERDATKSRYDLHRDKWHKEEGNESEKEVRKGETRWGKGRNKKLWTLDTDTDPEGKQQGRGVRVEHRNTIFPFLVQVTRTEKNHIPVHVRSPATSFAPLLTAKDETWHGFSFQSKNSITVNTKINN